MSNQTVSGPMLTAAPRADRSQPGGWSLHLGVVALLGATIVSLIIGSSIVPMEVEYGRLFTDTPAAYQLTVYVLAATMILWAILAVAALVTGIVSIVRRREYSRAIWGIALAVISPLVTVIALIGSMLVATMVL